jgi:hypothetical protein
VLEHLLEHEYTGRPHVPLPILLSLHTPLSASASIYGSTNCPAGGSGSAHITVFGGEVEGLKGLCLQPISLLSPRTGRTARVITRQGICIAVKLVCPFVRGKHSQLRSHAGNSCKSKLPHPTRRGGFSAMRYDEPHLFPKIIMYSISRAIRR